MNSIRNGLGMRETRRSRGTQADRGICISMRFSPKFITRSKDSSGSEPRRTTEYLRVPLDVEGAARALAKHFDPDDLYWAMVDFHRRQ
jgi:hypothetical protein